MYWRRGASKIEDTVDLHIQWECYIVPHEFKVLILHKMRDIALASCEEIVDAQYIFTAANKTVA
jgi:hypothetical protein